LFEGELQKFDIATSIALVGCSKGSDEKQQAAAAQKMPPAEVGVIVACPSRT
jgi:membrane fusion protein (multidrug efflux system)